MGRINSGVAKVLSTTKAAPASAANSAIKSRSPTRSNGFEIVSITMQPGLGFLDLVIQRGQIADVDEIDRHAHWLEHLSEQRRGRAIKRVRGQHRLTPIGQRRKQRHVNRHHARRTHLGAVSRFEFGQQFFQARSRGVVVAAIAESRLFSTQHAV